MNGHPRPQAPVSLARPRSQPFFGLRRQPGRSMIAVFRLPQHLYRQGWGWMLGRTFLLLVHVGRNTGEPHETVARVLGDEAASGEVVICSAWGPDADWIHNLGAWPAREVRVGRERFVPAHERRYSHDRDESSFS
jgi:deazaflavin-dependent oxidoreductase (nitroreductase family)